MPLASARAQKALLQDTNVASVSIIVHSSSGPLIGNGTLANHSSYWGGNVTVSATGPATFDAYAFSASGFLLYSGKAAQTLSGSGDSITIGVGTSTLEGGSIPGSSLSLSPAVSTVAGQKAKYGSLSGICGDASHFFLADSSQRCIFEVDKATGTASLLAGSGVNGHLDGVGAAAEFNGPAGLCGDGTYLYVTDNDTVRRIAIATGSVTTIAGTAGSAGSADGAGSTALFSNPLGIATDGTNLYIADNGNDTIRQIELSSDTVSTLAGTANKSGTADGTGSAARFFCPNGITTDGTNLFVTDNQNYTIRQIVISSGLVNTLAGLAGTHGSTDGVGTAARFYAPCGISTDGTNVFVADTSNHTIRQVVIASQAVTTLAGSTATAGFQDGTSTSAQFSSPWEFTTTAPISTLPIAERSAGSVSRTRQSRPFQESKSLPALPTELAQRLCSIIPRGSRPTGRTYISPTIATTRFGKSL